MDKKIISQNFGAASNYYNDNADIQKYCAKILCDFSQKYLTQTRGFSLDLGSGTGFVAKNLETQKIIELDLSVDMLKKSQNKYKISADISRLPFKNKENFDVIYSSFSLQWLDDYEELFKQIHKILKKDGIFAFCIPTFESLQEIKNANEFSATDFYILDLPNENYIVDKLEKSGLKKLEVKTEIISKEYRNAADCLKKIKKIGANFSLRNKNFISKKQLQKFNDFFLQKHQNITNWNIKYFVYKK